MQLHLLLVTSCLEASQDETKYPVDKNMIPCI